MTFQIAQRKIKGQFTIQPQLGLRSCLNLVKLKKRLQEFRRLHLEKAVIKDSPHTCNIIMGRYNTTLVELNCLKYFKITTQVVTATQLIRKDHTSNHLLPAIRIITFKSDLMNKD